MNFKLPPKEQVGLLDAEIAGEGEKIIYSDGETIQWTPPPPRPVMPDWSQIKSIAKYFNRHGYQPWPAWLYHPSEPPRLLKNADEASELGVVYRRATSDENARYGLHAVWDWSDDSLWRPQPYERDTRFDPTKLGQGKTLVHLQRDSSSVQNDLVQALVPTIAAAVAKALQTTGPSAPAHVDAADWKDFLAFKAFQKTQQAADMLSAESEVEEAEAEQGAEEEAAEPDTRPTNALSGAAAPQPPESARPARVAPREPVKAAPVTRQGVTNEQERSFWEEEAKSRGIDVDSRWSLKKLKQMVEQAD